MPATHGKTPRQVADVGGCWMGCGTVSGGVARGARSRRGVTASPSHASVLTRWTPARRVGFLPHNDETKNRGALRHRPPPGTGRLALVGRAHRGVASRAGGAMGAPSSAGWRGLGRRQRGGIRLDVALDGPRAGLQGRARGGPAWASRAWVCGALRGRQGGRRPALGHRGAGLLSGGGGAKALGVPRQAGWCEARGCARWGVRVRGRRPRTRRGCLPHPPALGPPRGAHRQGLRAGVGIARGPGSPREPWAHDLRHPLEGGGHTGEPAQRGPLDGRVLPGALGRGDESAWRGCGRAGTPPRRRPLWAHRGVCGVASPALAHHGDAPVWRHPPCPHRRLQGGPGRLGGAGGAAQGVRVARRARRAGARQAGRRKRLAAPRQAVWRPERQRQCLPHQGAALGQGGLQRAAQRATGAPLGLAAVPQPQREGWRGQKLRRARYGPRGQAQARAAPPSHGCAWRDPLGLLWPETSVHPSHQLSGRAHRRQQAQGIATLNAHGCPVTILP
jgi:hypothetical protein